MIFLQLTQQLQSLKTLLLCLSKEQYGKKISYLGNASIGGHARHIIELLKCVADGYSKGKVDYVNRIRNLSLENNSYAAIQELDMLTINIMRPDKQLLLITACDDSENTAVVATSFYREIVYNTEHTIHHLALIRVALREMQLQIVDDNFGMAYSTIKFLSTQTTVQNCS